MGWLSKIFKGSCHGVSKERHFHGYGEDPVLNDDASASEDHWSVNEDEDVDRAVALSLAEEEEKQKQAIDFESQLEEDEQLARALQESMKAVAPSQPVPPSQPVYDNGNFSQPIPSVPFSTGYRICAGCHNVIGFGRFLNCMGAFWHPECFRCHGCSLPISGYEFSMCGAYPYHKACYKDQYHPKCGVCNQFIPTNAAGLIEYRAHPFWEQKYCPVHEIDETSRCCSCERMEPHGAGYISLNDGRRQCLECLDSAVMDTNQCQPLYFDIQEFYENLGMKVEQEVPLLLVERQALNEAMVGERQGHHHMPETRGLCLSEEQTITTVRRPKHWGRTGLMNVTTEPYKLARRCEVTAILILFGLPRLLTGSILAHEMMHAWLRLKGYRMLNPQIEEGICQVLAYMWLETQLNSKVNSSQASSSCSSGKRSPFELRLGKFFKNQIESDISPIYGDGFRAANQSVLKYGLNRTLDQLWMTGSLPF